MTPEIKKEKGSFTFDVNTVVYVLYLMYKRNLITRHDLRGMFKIIKEKLPEDVMKYLVEEEKKAT